MSTATAKAYQPYFIGRFVPLEMRKSPQNKAFYGRRDAYSGKAHCIKDRVLLDGTCGTGYSLIHTSNDRIVKVGHGYAVLPMRRVVRFISEKRTMALSLASVMQRS